MNYSNYRPIPLLPSIEKIMKRCIADKLSEYLTKYGIFNNKMQYGFQKAKSTSDLLIKFSDYLNTKLDDNIHALVMFIDFSKAFDTLDHDKLVKALHLWHKRPIDKLVC